ncbi:GGDEF domain-containing protein [Desulforamulus ruminis]|uniref:Diguanylate cyclase n=1 Tax=Desulforamulus ruminis (strain ATCC 23193 / DSM 2154 / NCIMB 8452 / DL) TaxID=696281 RepID=F6DMC9_DESRL|nr:GGDEF domain-containing protein [Desulforamulus ruminis]AEG60596.1 diguanylate cyclase [Desulforamulus ruminis DSM 2154]
MMKFASMDDAAEKIKMLKNLYIGIRIVDPKSKAAVDVLHQSPTAKLPLCYQFWDTGRICENCISMRALNGNGTAIKIAGKSRGIYAVTAVPVLIADRRLVMELIQDVTGNLCFETGETCNDPNLLMTSISKHIEYLLTRDELTGLYNRRFIDERLPGALEEMHKSGEPLSVIYADLDFFKSVNDAYGHVVGDQVLCGVGKVFQENVRSEESWVARYGGEEFLICLPGIDCKTALQIAERLRKAIMQEEFQIGEKVLHITCSFGVETLCGKKHKITAREVVELADKKLYKAKYNGRNKVV